jgi:hypothetical protein
MDKKVIGTNAYIGIMGIKAPAKSDTAADSTSVWASNIKMSKDGVLSFTLFDKSSPFYTGEVIERTDYSTVVTRNSHGGEKISYRTHLTMKLAGRKINALVTLSDRSKNNFPILIGKRTIRGKFIVDVSKSVIKTEKNAQTATLNDELKQDSYKFHQKYFGEGE